MMVSPPCNRLPLTPDGLLGSMHVPAGLEPSVSTLTSLTAPSGASSAAVPAAALTPSLPVEAAVVGTTGTGLTWPPSLTWEDVLAMSAPSSWIASGELWMLAAAQSMAVGTVMVRCAAHSTVRAVLGLG